MSCDCQHHKDEVLARLSAPTSGPVAPKFERFVPPRAGGPASEPVLSHVERAPGKYKPLVDFVWEDPNIGNATHGEVAKLLPELRRNPGKWARLLIYKSATGAGTSATKLKERFTDIEFTTRRLPESGSAVYARFVEAEDDE